MKTMRTPVTCLMETKDKLGELYQDNDFIFPNTVAIGGRPGRVWMPATFGFESALAQKMLRIPAGRNGLDSGICTEMANAPDGAMMVDTVFFENMPRV